MKNTTQLNDLLGLMTRNQGDLPPDLEVWASGLLGIDPSQLRYIDVDTLNDLSQDELGIEVWELPFETTRKTGRTYTTEEETGQYWVGTIGGLPAIQTTCFGLTTWFMGQ